VQNEVLFSSDSGALTLFALDRLYTFKAALSSYSRTGIPRRLEDAVDELRRLFLSTGGRKVARADVLRSYEWLSATDAALRDVDEMYRRGYGGVDGVGAIEGMASTGKVVEELRIEIEEAMGVMGCDVVGEAGDVEIISPVDEEPQPELFTRRRLEVDAIRTFVPSPIKEEEEPTEEGSITKAVASFQLGTPSPTLPKLTLFTNFEKKPAAPIRELGTPGEERDGQEDLEEEEEAEDLTARPKEQPLVGGRVFPLQTWQNVSIAEMMMCQTPGGLEPMSAVGGEGETTGPMTPNGYDDISPITRGEWGFLFSGENDFKGAKTVCVTTW
jgi:hypothetical protein